MIKSFEIILGTFVSNMDVAGYTPVAEAAIKSWCDVPFCDTVLVVDGQSVDDTTQIISNLNNEKIEIHIAENQWPPDSWTWDDIRLIETECIQAVNSRQNTRKIYMWLPIDTVIGLSAHDEIQASITSLIEDEGTDFLLWGWRKAITPRYVSGTAVPSFGGWYMQSITKFQPNIEWGEVPTEVTIEANRKISGRSVSWKNAPICYDMFMFTKEHVQKKLDRHCGTPDNLKPYDAWVSNYISKYNGKGLYEVSNDYHPSIVQETFLDQLTDEHFGFDLFGNENLIRSKGRL